MKTLLALSGCVGLLFAAFNVTIAMQVSDTEDMCRVYKVGDKMPDIEKLDADYHLSAKGPYFDETSQWNKVVFCASATLCDFSCAISFKDSLITQAELTAPPS